MSTAIQETAAAGATATDAAGFRPSSDTSSEEPRVYRGRTVDELIPKIQAELGSDAIVIRRQSGLTGGIAGFFQRPYVEIVARRGSPGVDRYDEDDAAPAMPGEYDADLDAAPAAPSALDEEFRELTAASLNGEPTASNVDSSEESRATLPAPFAAALAAAEATAADPQPPAGPPQPTSQPPSTSQSASASRSRARDAIERRLRDVGLGEELRSELLEAATAHAMPLMPARTSLARAVQTALRERIPVARALPAGSATIALVGPGGSGKTSCCAALLGAYRKRSSLPAACVTVLAGGQRGALEMLLSPHLTEPVAVHDPHALAALRTAREEGVVLLDTPPLSPADDGSIRALAGLLGELRVDRVVLTLPATLGAKPAAQLLEALRPVRTDAIAITHADETDQLGVAIDAAISFGLAPAYILQRGRGGGLSPIEPGELAERLLPPR